MAFRPVFIGIDRHQDPSIRELAAARLDAVALHALFSDTIGVPAGRLLVDEQATQSAVVGLLEDTLLGAGPDDTALVTFAGHGTRDHRLVIYDTDHSNLLSTTLPMNVLGDYFRRSPARAVLCVLDCCFSGAAPARVLDDSPASRDPSDPLLGIAGAGRILIAACGPNEPALEVSGHGLLTSAVIKALTQGDTNVDLVSAMAEIMRTVRGAAGTMGYVQTPTLYGHVEGGLTLPRLVRGKQYSRAFPDPSVSRVTGPLNDLSAFGMPLEAIAEWEKRFKGGLNSLQVQAVNNHRVLDGRSVVVVAPTSSGKTFIGEMAAIRAYKEGRKSVFLLPYKALVNEKYDQFAALYGNSLGVRVIRSTGDYLDDNARFLSGRYDLALLTYEMFLGLAVSSPHLLTQLGLVVLDEAQFMTDPKRGIVVELLLTFLLAARDRGIFPQLILLSAVVGDANGFEDWLGSGLLRSLERPVPLCEGVLDRGGTFEYIDENGNRGTQQLLDRNLVVQRREKPSAQDMLVPLVAHLVAEGQKVIVFRNAKGPAEGCAAYLARDLRLPGVKDLIEQLPTQDLSAASHRLRECLAGGVAFHNTNLGREERQAVERSFRDPASQLRVLVATTTVAAGINTPASTVVLAEQEFLGEDGRPFTVAEYKNMAGRAGRLGFNEKGTSIILTDAEHPRGLLFGRYIAATAEPLRSSFKDEGLTTWLIRLLVQVESVERDQVSTVLSRTYAGFCLTRQDPGWARRMASQVEELLQRMTALSLIEENERRIRLSLLGRACGRSALSFESSMKLIELIRGARALAGAQDLIALVQCLSEADSLATPMVRGRRGEPEWIEAAMRLHEPPIVHQMQSGAKDMRAYQARCKRACMLHDWIEGRPVSSIEAHYTKGPYAQVGFGVIRGAADATRFWLGSASEILQLVLTGASAGAEMPDILIRLELGIPSSLLRVANLPVVLQRGEYLTLASAGLDTPEKIATAPSEQLGAVLPAKLALQLAEAARKATKPSLK